VAGALDQQERLRLGRGLEQGLRMMQRHDRVLFALDDEDGHRRERPDVVDGAIVVVDRERERPLERPGEPEAAELLLGELAVARGRALDHERPDPVFVSGALKRRDGERAAEALAEDGNAPGIDLWHREQRSERRLDVQVRAVKAGLAIGAAVAAVVRQQHVEAFGRHPGDARDVRADVLGVAVQEEDAAHALALGRQKPAVQAYAVLRLEPDVAIGEADVIRRPDMLGHGMEDETRAAAEPEAQQQHEEPLTHQKYRFSDEPHSRSAPAPSSSRARSSLSARLRLSARLWVARSA
jgi:hypothetical protein